MSRVLGVFYLAGSLLVIASLFLPHPAGANSAGLLAVASAALVGGYGSLFAAKNVRIWTVHAVLAFGTVLICLCIHFAGVVSGIYSAMFIWVVLVAVSFFSPRAVVAHIAWILLAWGLTLTTVMEPTGFSDITRWTLGGFVLVVSALVMGEIVAGRRSAEDRLRAEAEERQRLQHELEHLAFHDPLTGLPNRRLFEEELPRELARAKRHGTPLSLVAVDLNEFKRYNDLNGHVAGDELLKGSASAWDRALRAEDLIARLGGDEFVALLPDCPLTEAELVAERLCSGVPLEQTCSTGVACWDERESAEELLKRVDKAMYESKERTAARAVIGTARLEATSPVVRNVGVDG
jgi:diguanylate cyclase (GGDEF)-like protein